MCTIYSFLLHLLFHDAQLPRKKTRSNPHFFRFFFFPSFTRPPFPSLFPAHFSPWSLVCCFPPALPSRPSPPPCQPLHLALTLTRLGNRAAGGGSGDLHGGGGGGGGVGGGGGGGGGPPGLDPNSYFGPGGRYNMRRKSDCGAERGGGMQIPDPSYFAAKKRNRSLDRTEELEDFAAQQAAQVNAPPGLLQFQMMYQRRESAARGGGEREGETDREREGERERQTDRHTHARGVDQCGFGGGGGRTF